MSLAPEVPDDGADWHRRVVGRSLRTARQRSIDRGGALIQAAATLLERSDGEGFTVQDVADEAGQSLRTLYQYFESKDDLLLAVFEEAMASYATLIQTAIEGLDDPLDRLTGALLAAARLPELSAGGVNRGLAKLRLKLATVEPALVGRSQAPVTSLIGELLDAAVAAGQIAEVDRASATYVLLTLNTAAITSATLGNDVGVHEPGPTDLVTFGLRALGADVSTDRLDAIGGRLRLPKRKLRLEPTEEEP